MVPVEAVREEEDGTGQKEEDIRHIDKKIVEKIT